MRPILITLPGWVVPPFDMENESAPPILRANTQQGRAVQNLMGVMNAVSEGHGTRRLTPLEMNVNDGDGDYIPQYMGGQRRGLLVNPRDCKEAPQRSGCSSRSKGKGTAKIKVSTGWYNSCRSVDCLHGRGSMLGLDSLSDTEAEPIQSVMDLPSTWASIQPQTEAKG